MKYKICLLLLSVMMIWQQKLIAQSTSANNTIGVGKFLGYSGAQDVEFRTNGTTRMTLTQTTGRLGLGTSTPNSIFHLSTTATGDLFRTDGPTAGINRWQLFTGGTERFRLYSDAGTSPFMAMRSLSNGLRFETGGSDIRMRINGTQTSLINGFTINNSGFTCLVNNQNFWTTSVAAPYSLLHLAGSGTNGQELGYRPWMVDGITFTGNSDMSFIGPRSIAPDITEFAVVWSDNTSGVTGPDDFVVRFTNGDGTASSGPASNEGLELMRFAAENDGRVGIGDEFGTAINARPERRLHVHDPGTNNLSDAQFRISQNITSVYADFRATAQGNLYLNMTGAQQRVGIEEQNPIEKLDVSGNLRLQNIPLIAPNCVLLGQNINFGVSNDNRVTRLDMTYNPDDYLGGDGAWHSIGASAPCDWNLVTNGTSDDLVMGYPGACNEGKVAIGTVAPDAKLTVSHISSQTTERGIRVFSSGGTVNNYGIDAVSGGGDNVFGVRAEAVSPSKSYGGLFIATASASAGAPPSAIGCTGRATAMAGAYDQIGVQGNAASGKYNKGVLGIASGTGTSLSSIGVYGEATGSGALWAMWSQGSSFATGLWQSSDEILKNNISSIDNALDMISHLEPKSYTFRTEEFPQLNLPNELQYGLIAQELENVLPHLVKDCLSPESRDIEGNLLAESVSFKAVNYIELIPLLIQAVKDQQQQISGMQEQLYACCTDITRSSQSMESPHVQNVELRSTESIVLNQNVPNPFAEQTTIQYSIDVDFTRAQILFYDGNGKLIQTSDIKTKGAGQINVFADDLTNGVYSYALVVDGSVIDTKRMVKQ